MTKLNTYHVEVMCGHWSKHIDIKTDGLASQAAEIALRHFGRIGRFKCRVTTKEFPAGCEFVLSYGMQTSGAA